MTDLLSKEGMTAALKDAAFLGRTLVDGEVVTEFQRIAMCNVVSALVDLVNETSARREAAEKPVYQVVRDGGWHDVDEHAYKQAAIDKAQTRIVFTSSPLPVVPPAKHIAPDHDSWVERYAMGWNACRTTMLQLFGNSEQVSLRDGINAIRASGVSIDAAKIQVERDALNYPVIREGWALVPIEPTENMIIDGFESEPDESFSKPEDWEAYQAMSGCEQAAHRARLCWSAMIAAVPKLERFSK
ncbi:hypothetical protein B7L51_008705 [Pectobacterium brasiliense]|uniref:hypothetical protein n=1 Tax=Pectobacterium brasiliense TaxID=180957 RepID=UPI00191BADFA|nr:hypothetical protein [Pectobacterium carotovorum]